MGFLLLVISHRFLTWPRPEKVWKSGRILWTILSSCLIIKGGITMADKPFIEIIRTWLFSIPRLHYIPIPQYCNFVRILSEYCILIQCFNIPQIHYSTSCSCIVCSFVNLYIHWLSAPRFSVNSGSCGTFCSKQAKETLVPGEHMGRKKWSPVNIWEK